MFVNQDEMFRVTAVTQQVGHALDRTVLPHLYLVDKERLVTPELKLETD